MRDYRYTLIRYVPDLQRMEPINVGVILQGQDGTRVQFSPHAAKRKDIDTDAFNKWKQFFVEEIDGEAIPLFQPEKASSAFLRYLEDLCEGPVVLSKPLVVSIPANRTSVDLLESLFDRLVMPPKVESARETVRPTGRFRKVAAERGFLQRGMKKYAHVEVPNRGRWTAYRQVLNGEFVAIDKVEVSREIGWTATEIDKLPHVIELLKTFKETMQHGKRTRYVLLADELNAPFSEQSPSEFEAMQADLEQSTVRVRELGGEVIRTPDEAESFANELDEQLPAAV